MRRGTEIGATSQRLAARARWASASWVLSARSASLRRAAASRNAAGRHRARRRRAAPPARPADDSRSPTLTARLWARRSGDDSTWMTRAPGRQRRAGRVPDFLEEGAADQEHDVGAVERLADGDRVEGQAEPEVRVRARQHLMGPDPLAPDRRAERARPAPPPRPPRSPRRRPTTMTGRRLPSSSSAAACTPAGIGLGRAVEAARRERLDVGLLLEHVDRQRDEDRSRRRVGGDLERAVHDQRELVGALDLHAPLGERRGHRHQVVAEHRPAQPQARVLLSGGDDAAASAPCSAL